MSSFTRPSSASRTESEIEPTKPWCMLTSETRTLFQTALVDPDTISTRMEFRLAHVWGQRGYKVDLRTPDNIFYLKINKLHDFDDRYWAFLPNIDLLKKIHQDVTNECRRRRPRWPDWLELHKPVIREFQFIPIGYMTDSNSVLRYQRPYSLKALGYTPPFDTFPLLRSHVHPYLAIYSAVSKLSNVSMDDLPAHVHEHVTLAREIWECWMSVSVPPLAINAGHIRTASRRAPSNLREAIQLPFTSSSSTASSTSTFRSSPSSPSSVFFDESTTRLKPHRYCALKSFRPFYSHSQRDPRPPKSAFVHYWSSEYHSEAPTESNASDSREPLGVPVADEPHWWPDEHITRSCVASTSSGIWYTHRSKREFIHEDLLDTSDEGSVNSYNTIPPRDQNLTFWSNYPRVLTALKLAEYQRQKQREREREEIESWRRAVKSTKPPAPNHDAYLRQYSTEQPTRPLRSSHRTWRPDSLDMWPTWTLKRRSQLVAAELSKQPKKRVADDDGRATKRRRT